MCAAAHSIARFAIWQAQVDVIGQYAVVARGSGFRVSREGKAMENGSQGEKIRVRFDRREILDARVASQGVLHIDF
ncbi:MAG: flagella basal body P-ring formation protein FlgA [Halomonadaceae bacterium]